MPLQVEACPGRAAFKTESKCQWVKGCSLSLKRWQGVAVTSSVLLATAVSGVAQAAEVVVVNVDVLNLRSGPGTSYAAAGQVLRGMRLEVLQRQGDWIKVRTPAGKEAWVAGWLVTAPGTATPPAAPPPQAPAFEDLSGQLATAAPKSGVLNVRSGPGTSFAVMGQVQASRSYPALGKQSDWIKIALPDGREGWIAGWLANLKVLSLADFTVTDGGKAVVALATSVPVRRLPRADFDGIVDVPAGTRLTYITTQEGWHRVKTSGGVVGWVDASATKLVSSADFSRSPVYTMDDGLWQLDEFATGSITGSGVNLRSGPGTGYKPITQMAKGTPVRLLASQSGWHHVALADGRDGWVAASLVAVGQRPQVGQISVKELSPQKKLVTIQGSFGSAATLKEFDGGKSLALYLGPVSVNPAAMDLNARELGGLNLSGNGVLLSFRELPRYRVVANGPGKVQLELTTSLDGVELQTSDTRQTLVFKTHGFITPSAAYDESTGTIRLRLPGTSFAGAQPSVRSDVVQSLQVTTDDAGTTVQIASSARGRFLLRRGVNQVSLELLPAGLAGKTIVVDAGHGGYDPGALGLTGLQEKAVNLDIALRVQKLLEQAGARVLMTRTTDVAGVPADELNAVPSSERLITDLTGRTDLANQNKADLFISVHNNLDPAHKQSGTAVYWTGTNFNADRSLAFARVAQRNLVSALGRQDNGTKNNDFYVIKYTEAPSVLMEILFLSDPTEESMLRSEGVLQNIAQAVLDSVQQYYQ